MTFGVGCIVFDDNVTRGEKFNPRGYEGAVVGYGPFPGVYKVIDPSKLRETGIVNIVTTRDVKIKTEDGFQGRVHLLRHHEDGDVWNVPRVQEAEGSGGGARDLFRMQEQCRAAQ